MRPDRIIVGEVRGGEALDMLQAMNTGHEGSLSTAHANSPRDLLSRLETMALMSDVELPVAHVREQIAGALDLIVHVIRLPDGRRTVSRVAAVEGLVAGSVVLQDVFRWRRGPGSGFETTGTMSSVAKLLAERDERVDPRIFGTLAVSRAAPPDGHSRLDSKEPSMSGPARTPRAASRWHWPGRVRRLGTILE
jgi:pilus assembly protein CpaF